MGRSKKLTERETKAIEPDKLEREVELYAIEDFPEETSHLNMPQMDEEEHYNFMGRMRNYWQQYKPKSVFDYVARVAVPGYALWKMPPEMHKYLNGILSSATELSALVGQEEIALGTGIAYAISQTIYGLKTSSGKHVISGLQGIVLHSKKMDTSRLGKKDKSKLEDTIKSAEDMLDKFAEQAKKKEA